MINPQKPYLVSSRMDDQSPEAVLGFQQDGGAITGEDAVEDHGPDITEHNAADEVRHEEHGAVEVGALDALGQRIGRRKAEDIDKHKARHGKQRRIPEGVAEACVTQGGDIVAKADKGGILDEFELAEGKINTLDEGPDKADGECRCDRAEKQPEPPAQGIAENARYALFQYFISLFICGTGMGRTCPSAPAIMI